MKVQLLDQENGHIVLPYTVDVPLSCQYEEITGGLVIDSPTLKIGNDPKAGILRLTFSPEAARSLLRELQALEEKTRSASRSRA